MMRNQSNCEVVRDEARRGEMEEARKGNIEINQTQCGMVKRLVWSVRQRPPALQPRKGNSGKTCSWPSYTIAPDLTPPSASGVPKQPDTSSVVAGWVVWSQAGLV